MMTFVSRLKYQVLVAGLLLALGGCGGGPDMVVRSSFVEFTPEQRQEIEAQGSREYRIQESDVLLVAFAHQKELNQEGVLVLSDGAVNLIGLDRLELAGRTLAEADSLITAAYSKEYRDPVISISILESKGRRVYVLGEVRSPGMQTLPRGGVGVYGAVSLAGGFTPDASPEGAVLVRVSETGYMVKEMDLSGIRELESLSLAMVELMPYDVIYVPRSRIGDFAYFSRSVLSGLVSMTRVATDLKYLSGGGWERF